MDGDKESDARLRHALAR